MTKVYVGTELHSELWFACLLSTTKILTILCICALSTTWVCSLSPPEYVQHLSRGSMLLALFTASNLVPCSFQFFVPCAFFTPFSTPLHFSVFLDPFSFFLLLHAPFKNFFMCTKGGDRKKALPITNDSSLKVAFFIGPVDLVHRGMQISKNLYGWQVDASLHITHIHTILQEFAYACETRYADFV